ncbi:MAG: ATP-binding protein [Gemmatimonadota bacterium]|nr:ATP-binding protein [Gemmatimonadota bacterium]
MSATPPLDYAELYRVLAESTPDAIITIDEASTVLSANPAAERMFGYSAAEMIGAPLHRLMPERMRTRHSGGMARYRNTGVRHIPWSGLRLPVLTKDGREVPVEISFGEFVANGRRIFSGTLRDVAGQLAAESALIAANEQLANQAAELEEQVEEAQALSEELEQANRLLTESNAAAMHALEALREGEARARRLLALAAGLSEAATPEAVADVIFLEGLVVLGGDAGSLAIVHEEDGQPTGFELVRSAGYDEQVVRHYQRSPLRPGRPLTEAILTRRPVMVDSAAALTERFPEAAPEMIAMGFPAFTVIPVVHGDHVLAALNFSFRAAQAFDEGILTFLETVGQLCSQALVRARMFESEQQARARSEIIRRDTEFLAETGRVLGSSLEYELTLQSLVHAAVPELGDWCAVDVVAESSVGEWPPTLDRLAVHNADPARTQTGLELARRYPPTWTEHDVMTRALKYGETVFIPEVTDDMIVTGARDEAHLDLVRRFGVTSVLIVPLQARGRTLGALTLCMTESHRHFSDRDRALAEELGRRAGFAVDNARLYHTAELARVEAVRANRAKSDLLAKVSHETRQPVHATIGWSDTLALGIYGSLSTEQADALHRIKQNQERLLSVLNDLLDISRIEAGKLELRPVAAPLGELLESAEAAILPQMRAKAIEYTASIDTPDLTVHADRDLVSGIITNLLSNAVKFTAANGRVTLTCSAAGSNVLVRVADNGVGIPADALERIFEPFFQVDSGLTRTTMGTGLGLSISREAARAMGGDITVESTEGQGSTFTLTLPAA